MIRSGTKFWEVELLLWQKYGYQCEEIKMTDSGSTNTPYSFFEWMKNLQML